MSRPGSLKLLFLTQTYPRFEGDTAGPFIRDLARGLARRGDQVTVLAPHAPEVARGWEDFSEDGGGRVSVQTFRYAPERFELLGYSRSLDADEAVKGGAALVAPLYWAAARRAVAREAKESRRRGEALDLVHAHWVVPNGLAMAPLSPLPRGLPFAVGLHGSDVFLAERAGVRQWVARVMRRASLLTGCSPELVARVRALGFPEERSRVIPYGVDTETFHPRDGAEGPNAGSPDAGSPDAGSPDAGNPDAGGWRSELGIPLDAPLILSVGRMATKKGYQVLLPGLERLFARHPRAHLVLAGAGDRLEEFREAARPWRDRVHFPGAVYRDRLPALYRAADLFVLPAVHDRAGNVDGLPNVILEALATGLPVVASAISGIPLAVEDARASGGTGNSDEGNGRLVPEGDLDALLDALDDLLSSEDRRRRLGRAGRHKAESELTWDAVAGRYRQAYLETLGRAS